MPEAWIAALVGLHDFGKASPGFQLKLGRSHIGGYRLERDQPDRHDISTAGLLSDQLKNQGVHPRTAVSLSHAVAAHHGHPFTNVEIVHGNRWDVSETWALAHRALFRGVIHGTGATDLPLPAMPSDPAERSAFLQWLMGLTTTADWIGSSEALCRWERLPEWKRDPRAWYQSSSLLAQDALDSAGLLSPSLLPEPDGFAAVQRVLGSSRSPRPLQVAVANLLDVLPEEPALVVIEAPMGEGKTEAALSCATGSRGIYVAMPTQATSNALFPRLAQFLEAQPQQAATFPIALAHGSGGIAPAQLKLREIGLGTPDSTVQACWWFQGSKRALLCAQGIGTVDQGLIGVLNTRHGFLRLFGLSGRTVIFDEVHAYDTYTGGLIERLIAWLKVLGCRVVVMSATLPACQRQSLLQAWAGSAAAEPPAASYPRISWAVAGQQQAVGFAASRQQQVQVRSIPADLDALAVQAAGWASQGARVLVVVNKVTRAQALFRRLAGTRATLFHARFPMRQRLEIEKDVLELFGPDGRARGGHVLVATQVAEQSLDIDLDVLITDPAPVDLVLQRHGRIHRHERERPDGFEEPVVYVGDLDQPMPSRELSSFVYSDWDVLRSVAWLQAQRELSLPEDIDRAVQDVYGDWEPAGDPALMAALGQACIDHASEQNNMAAQARKAALRSPQDWRIESQNERQAPLNDDDAESGAHRFGTRLGEDSQSVVPVWPGDLEVLESRAALLAGNHLRLSHRALIKTVRQAELPPGWKRSSGLAAHRPLFLDGDGNVVGSSVRARLDPVLGLVVGEEA
jgi:CRISPR-associated endonuclease/helicase Cas3